VYRARTYQVAVTRALLNYCSCMKKAVGQMLPARRPTGDHGWIGDLMGASLQVLG
jgi:hypothetical protein